MIPHYFQPFFFSNIYILNVKFPSKDHIDCDAKF